MELNKTYFASGLATATLTGVNVGKVTVFPNGKEPAMVLDVAQNFGPFKEGYTKWWQIRVTGWEYTRLLKFHEGEKGLKGARLDVALAGVTVRQNEGKDGKLYTHETWNLASWNFSNTGGGAKTGAAAQEDSPGYKNSSRANGSPRSEEDPDQLNTLENSNVNEVVADDDIPF